MMNVNSYIKNLASKGKEGIEEGPIESMGVRRGTLPLWDDLQLLPAQLSRKPLENKDEEGNEIEVKTELKIGPRADKPLVLKIPLLVSDMSFGALSQEAKTTLALGSGRSGAGMCTGEGGFSPLEEEYMEKDEFSGVKYLFEMGTGKYGFKKKTGEYGFDFEKLGKSKHIGAFHFKLGQAAKTGIGGHLPGKKVTKDIARARQVEEKKDIISPATFGKDLCSVKQFKEFADKVRDVTGGIPIGFKISANHIEDDIQFAIDASADYIIIDGRGGSTGAAPTLFRDHISIPTIPALARAKRYLEKKGVSDRITLIVTGGLRVPTDFIKALALGADGVALSKSALHAIGCMDARECNENTCPRGIATQDERIRWNMFGEGEDGSKLNSKAKSLQNFFEASTKLMGELTKACGHKEFKDLSTKDLTTWKKEMADLSGVKYAGVVD